MIASSCCFEKSWKSSKFGVVVIVNSFGGLDRSRGSRQPTVYGDYYVRCTMEVKFFVALHHSVLEESGTDQN